MSKIKEYSEDLAIELKNSLENVEIKGDEEDKDFVFDVIASTEDVDRDWEIIKIKAWDTKNWEKNPVVLANHQYRIETIIWKWLKFYTSKWKKRLKWVFSKTNPLWLLAKDLYNEWMLKTVSVWFIAKKRNEEDWKIIEEAELLEVSFVAVPANPEAISMDWKSADLYKKWIDSWLLVPWEKIKKEKEKNWQEDEEKDNEESSEKNFSEEKMFKSISEMKEDIAEIKSAIKSLADKNAEKIDQEKLEEKKSTLQSIDKLVGEALKEFKTLKK